MTKKVLDMCQREFNDNFLLLPAVDEKSIHPIKNKPIKKHKYSLIARRKVNFVETHPKVVKRF